MVDEVGRQGSDGSLDAIRAAGAGTGICERKLAIPIGHSSALGSRIGTAGYVEGHHLMGNGLQCCR